MRAESASPIQERVSPREANQAWSKRARSFLSPFGDRVQRRLGVPLFLLAACQPPRPRWHDGVDQASAGSSTAHRGGLPPSSVGSSALRPPGSIVLALAPECSPNPSLRPYLEAQHAELERACQLGGWKLEAVPPMQLSARLQRARTGFLIVYLAGHGIQPGAGEHASFEGGARLCVEGAESLSIDELASALPEELSGALFIVNACFSAQVDPRNSPVPLSIVSASPFSVRTDSLFGETVASALLAASRDANCDGLITDEEFFDQLTHQLAQRPPLTTSPTFPKLRRNATSEIPLPIAPRSTPRCATLLAERRGRWLSQAPRWGELGRALLVQLELADFGKSFGRRALPALAHDFFFVKPGTSPDTARRLAELARSAGLRELPQDAVPQASDLARYMIFAEVYELSERCGWVDVVRKKDDSLLATRELSELRAALPSRTSWEHPRAGTSQPVLRRIGLVPRDQSGEAVPCYGSVGQCFRVAEQSGEVNRSEPR